MAPNGTLFLDEVGEMSQRMQAVLLRFLESGEIQRVGADRSHTRVNVRLITATNRDLETEVANGKFREDLFFRLNVIRLSIPPLRDRAADIPLLVTYFLQSYRQMHQTNAREISPEAMVERRIVRVLTTYSKTLYFIDRGIPRGTAYDQGRLFEDVLNAKIGSGHLKVHVQFVPLPRDELIPALLAGKGDVVMANLTVTPERAQTVDFTAPWIAGVDEIVVTSPHGPAIATVEDLSGQEVFVRASSSYYQSLLKLNARLTAEGKVPATLTPAPEALEDEDLLEMANAGLVNVLVVDNHKAWFWQRVWPALKLYPNVALRTGGEIAWAIRKNSPLLMGQAMSVYA